MVSSKLKKMVDKYTYRVEWSREDDAHVASCLEFPSLMAHGKTSVEALQQIEEVVLASIVWMQEENEPIPEPLGEREYKGKLTLRVSKELHKALVIEALSQGISMNQYILSKL